MSRGLVFRTVFLLSLLVSLVFIVGSVAVADEGGDSEQPSLAAANVAIVFSDILPNSIYRTIIVPNEGADVDIFAQDCCVRDDVVEIYVDGCLLASIDSIGGADYTHPGETHTVSLGPGTHSVEYRNVVSGVGPSGWNVSETLRSFTGDFLCGTCAVPDGSSPIMEQIQQFGSCGPEGMKDPIWGRFGNKPGGILVANSGEKLEIECADVGEGLLAFVLFYTSAEGNKLPVGMCPFVSGCNSSIFTHSGDSDGDNKPDCFVSTFWRSKDYGSNDDNLATNYWTGDLTEIPRRLDWAESLFNTNTKSVNKLDHKFEYAEGPPVPGSFCREGKFAKGPWDRSKHVDPESWPQASSLFGDFTHQLNKLEEETGIMEESPFALCDFNKDWACDEADEQILNDAFGKCRGEPGYNFEADVDGDGCVVTNDRMVTQVVIQRTVNLPIILRDTP